jgi:two-component system, OmpR family, sensor kinase
MNPWAATQRLARRTPLRVKLVLLMSTLVTVALVLTGIAAGTAMRHYLMNRVDSQLKVAAGQITTQAAHDGPNGPDFQPHPSDPDDSPANSCGAPSTSASGAASEAQQHSLLPSEYFVQIGDATGAPTGQASNFLVHCDAAPAIPKLTVAQVTARSGAPFSVGASVGGGEWRVVMSVMPGGQQTVAVAVPLADVDNTLHTLSLFEIGIGAGVLLILAGVGYLAVRRSLRPLLDVETTAEAIAAGDLTKRVAEADSRTEVGRLSGALNTMLGQIESAFRSQEASEQRARASETRMRRFVTDAGHELRTPLTSIRGFAELYRIGGVADRSDIDTMMVRIENESSRMGLLVDDLLLLARLDQHRPLDRELVDLAPIVRDAVTDAHAVAPTRDIRADIEADTVPLVIGDEPRLRQIVANLMSNALTHTPASASIVVRLGVSAGELRVSAGEQEPSVLLEVADTGPGLAPADAARVFERFYRVESSRSRTNGGSGLGLSIAAAIAAAHDGSIELETAEGKGATFRVRLPLATQASAATGGSVQA